MNAKQMILSSTRISHELLIKNCFNVDKLFYRMGDLSVWVDDGKYYFYAPNGQPVRIKNMLHISNLIYGNTQYLPDGRE